MLVKGISRESLSMAASLAYFAADVCAKMAVSASSPPPSPAPLLLDSFRERGPKRDDRERELLCVAGRMDEL